MQRRNFANLFLNEMGVVNAAGKMTLGQMSELFFMLVMPFFFVRLGVKWMLLAGMLAWVARYALFALGNPAELVFMYYAGILLHAAIYQTAARVKDPLFYLEINLPQASDAVTEVTKGYRYLHGVGWGTAA